VTGECTSIVNITAAGTTSQTDRITDKQSRKHTAYDAYSADRGIKTRYCPSWDGTIDGREIMVRRFLLVNISESGTQIYP